MALNPLLKTGVSWETGKSTTTTPTVNTPTKTTPVTTTPTTTVTTKPLVVTTPTTPTINTAPTITPTTAKPTSYNPQSNIDAMSASLKQQAMADLAAKKAAALSSLGAEQTALTQNSVDQRNNTSTMSQLQAKNFAEYMASRGLNRMGANNGTMDYAVLARGNQLAGDIGNINNAETKGLEDIQRRRTLAEDAYGSGVTSANAGIDAKALELLTQAQQNKYMSDLQQWNTDNTRSDTLALNNQNQQNWNTTNTQNQNNWNTTNSQNQGVIKQNQDNWNTTNTQTQNQLGIENTRQAEQDKILKVEKEQKQYADSIKGLGDQMDYQAEINKITNDGDTSNDWKISILKQEREAKIQNKLQNEVATIGQYSNDYQAEINKRQPNDPLLPYLKTAQLQKIATNKTNTTTAIESQQKQAMDIWIKMGVATPEVANILGIPVGSTTSDYGVAQANINQSNASASASLSNAETNRLNATTKSEATTEKPFTTEQKNQYRNEAYTQIKALNTSDAVRALQFKRAEIEKNLGHTVYVNLYNDILARAIKAGETTAYNEQN